LSFGTICEKRTLSYPAAFSLAPNTHYLAFAIPLFKEALGFDKALGLYRCSIMNVVRAGALNQGMVDIH
jgi:hypothetical protein